MTAVRDNSGSWDVTLVGKLTYKSQNMNHNYFSIRSGVMQQHYLSTQNTKFKDKCDTHCTARKWHPQGATFPEKGGERITPFRSMYPLLKKKGGQTQPRGINNYFQCCSWDKDTHLYTIRPSHADVKSLNNAVRCLEWPDIAVGRMWRSAAEPVTLIIPVVSKALMFSKVTGDPTNHPRAVTRAANHSGGARANCCWLTKLANVGWANSRKANQC